MELQIIKAKTKMAFKESEMLELKKSTPELREAVVSVTSNLNKHWKGGPVPVPDFAGEG